MISDTTPRRPKKQNAVRDIVIIILVFALLAILIWRWFDLRIATLELESFPIGLNN